MNTIAELVRRNATQFGDRTAVIFEHERLSFSQMAERGAVLARVFHSMGLDRGARISILARNSLEYLDFYTACELAGFIAAPLNYRLAVPELSQILSNAQPGLVLFQSDFAVSVRELQDQHQAIDYWLCTDDIRSCVDSVRSSTPDAQERLQSDEGILPDDPVYLIHTSGTTGSPKGATLTQSSQYANAVTIAQEAGLCPKDVGLIVQPLFHVGAKFLQLAHFAAGACVVLQPEFKPSRVWEALAIQRLTTLQLAPTMIEMVLSARPEIVPPFRLRTLFYSAAPIHEKLLRASLDEFGEVLVQHYGSTEAGVVTTLGAKDHRPRGSALEQARLRSAGRPNADTQVRIVDDTRTPLPTGEVGEIQVKHAALFAGYWNDQDATAEAMDGEWLAMGDLGYMDEDAYLYIVDRKKDMIISGGENIYPREVENALLSHAAVQACAVIGAPDERWGETVVAEVVLVPGSTVEPAALIDHCRACIASYKKPTQIAFRKALPRLPNGKVDKVTLRKPYWQGRN